MASREEEVLPEGDVFKGLLIDSQRNAMVVLRSACVMHSYPRSRVVVGGTLLATS